MSLTGVLPYFRTRMSSLGHKREHTDTFNYRNIPESIIDGIYHLDFNPTIGNKRNQNDQDLGQSVTLRFFKKGFRDTGKCRDELIATAQEIMCDIINPLNATIGPAVKNVEFISMNIIPLDTSNDNTMYAEIEFTVRTFLQFT